MMSGTAPDFLKEIGNANGVLFELHHHIGFRRTRHSIFNCRFVEQIVTPVVLRVSLLSGTAIHIIIHTQTLGMRELSGSRTRVHSIAAILPLNYQLIKRPFNLRALYFLITNSSVG